jgi:hypothetical protein
MFHNVHVETRGRHLDATQASFLRAVPRWHVFTFVALMTWGATRTPGEMTWKKRFLTCPSLLLTWRLHYVAMCGVANVVCDTKMSHETSWSTDACIFWYFLGFNIVFLDVLCDRRMLSVTSYWAWQILGMSCGQKHNGFVHDDVIFKLGPPCCGWLPQIQKHMTDM